jgi:predicted nuclease of predicted toxin-antitoxin system
VRWLAGECVAPEIVRGLRSDGHDVVSILEKFRGAPDQIVMIMAGREGRLLLTEDSDFGELIFKRHFRPLAPGVVFIRMPIGRRSERLEKLREAIQSYGTRLIGNYLVVGEIRTRVRVLPAA